MIGDFYKDSVKRYRPTKTGKEWNYPSTYVTIKGRVQNLQMEEALRADGVLSKDMVFFCKNDEDILKDDKIVWDSGDKTFSVRSVVDYDTGNISYLKVMLREM